jgi:hypothetical protein
MHFFLAPKDNLAISKPGASITSKGTYSHVSDSVIRQRLGINECHSEGAGGLVQGQPHNLRDRPNLEIKAAHSVSTYSINFPQAPALSFGIGHAPRHHRLPYGLRFFA